jgi:hypothetical protein
MGNCACKENAAKEPAAKVATRDLAVAPQPETKPAETKPAQPAAADEDWIAEETCTITGADGKPQPVVVVAKNANGTYKVQFENGTEKDQVAKAALAPRSFAVGARVEGRWQEQSTWYPGTVAKDNGDNTYHVKFDDNTEDAKEPAWHMKAEDAGVPRAVGDRVGVRNNSSLTTRIATVLAVNADKTYKLQFDDETEPTNNVRQSYIKDLKWETDDSCEAEYFGNYYPATVVQTNADGTVKVKYHESTGIPEANVAADTIRCETFHVGQRVEIRWHGGSNGYPGQVTADNGNETYAVHFDDNTDVLRQAAWHMEPETEGQVWSYGDLVQARQGASAYFYDGTIVQVNGDGTYNVQDEAGTVNENIRQSYIKARETTH